MWLICKVGRSAKPRSQKFEIRNPALGIFVIPNPVSGFFPYETDDHNELGGEAALCPKGRCEIAREQNE